MKRILNIARKDILQTLRDRMSLLFLLIMPIAFTLLFGFAFGGSSTSQEISCQAVGVLDLDGSNLSRALKSNLAASGEVCVDEQAKTTALLEQAAAGKTLIAGVIVPAGYGKAAASGNPVKLILLADEATSAGQAGAAAIRTAANRLLSAVKTAQIAAKLPGKGFENALALAVAAWNMPPVGLQVSVTTPASTDKAQSSSGMPVSQTAPAMMVQFGIAGLLTAAQILVAERKNRCLQRLLTTAARPWQILLGHYLAMFSVVFGQFMLLIAFGQFVLKLDYLSQPAATLLITAATALCISALGLLVGALAKSEDQAIILSLIPMFVFSGLGGAWVPLEATGPTFQAIGHLSPVAWAMDGFKNILVRGLDIQSAWLPAVVLLGYAVLFFGLAVWRFRFK